MRFVKIAVAYVQSHVRYVVAGLVGMAVIYGGYAYFFGSSNDTADTSFYVVNTVDVGEVTSGIETTGDIVAAQKLDLDVYKQLSRIDAVNVQNGGHVDAGDVLIAFDSSDASVDAQSAQVSLTEAQLSLQEAQKTAVDPSTQIRTTENQIAGYQQTINNAENNRNNALYDFLNKDLEFIPDTDDPEALDNRKVPTISGRYVSTEQGYYTIEVYGSGSDTGLSYLVRGLESSHGALVYNKALPIGTRGLYVTFSTDVQKGDKWTVYVPNTQIAAYAENKASYEMSLDSVNKSVEDAKVSLANAQQELATLQLTDASDYRDLTVAKAQSTVSEAWQKLSQAYDAVDEREIVAPFAGTVEGMENVVEGATPTGGTSDSITLGTLISDEFLTTFTLGAADVSKVSVGQRVKVTVTSFSDQPTFDAYITQISSLPESSGVAQYEVKALLSYDRETASVVLREGMLADIEIVQEEKTDAVRIPTSAITYEQGQPMVTVIDSLTDTQQQQVDRMGIVRLAAGDTLPTYQVSVTLGIAGQYYTEITDGLTEGQMIVSTATTDTSSTAVVEQSSFGPRDGSGGGAGAGQVPPQG